MIPVKTDFSVWLSISLPIRYDKVSCHSDSGQWDARKGYIPLLQGGFKR